MVRYHSTLLSLAAAALMLPGAARATGITLSGSVVNLCVLTLSTPGTLGLSTDGRNLSSSETGGLKATLSIVASGTAPSILISVPSLTGPTASISGATTTLAYTSPGGASQAATSSASTYTMNRLLDTLTIDGRAFNNSGFATGSYSINATATCQQ